MAKNTIVFILIIVTGALIGAFLGKFIGLVVPAGNIRNMLATEISAGLSPATVNLKIIELTLGCLFKFNVTSIIGIITAIVIFRWINK